jgi:hypothetical protein
VMADMALTRMRPKAAARPHTSTTRGFSCQRLGADDGNRTRVLSLGKNQSTGVWTGRSRTAPDA